MFLALAHEARTPQHDTIIYTVLVYVDLFFFVTSLCGCHEGKLLVSRHERANQGLSLLWTPLALWKVEEHVEEM